MGEISVKVGEKIHWLNEGNVDDLVEALSFYGDPESYGAICIMGDSPCGDFIEDFSADHNNLNYNREMPGKKARNLIRRFFIEPRITWKSPKFKQLMELNVGWMYEGFICRRKKEDPESTLRFLVYYSNEEKKIFVEDLETGLKEEVYAIAPGQRRANQILKEEFKKQYPIDSDSDEE
jgi:hypothetical protein